MHGLAIFFFGEPFSTQVTQHVYSLLEAWAIFGLVHQTGCLGACYVLFAINRAIPLIKPRASWFWVGSPHLGPRAVISPSVSPLAVSEAHKPVDAHSRSRQSPLLLQLCKPQLPILASLFPSRYPNREPVHLSVGLSSPAHTNGPVIRRDMQVVGCRSGTDLWLATALSLSHRRRFAYPASRQPRGTPFGFPRP